MALKYRPELDGLRAVAVLAVIGFHLAMPIISGGSLGVDVFFVLSGFLITSILADEQARVGGIAYGAFIARRARRLLPALFALLAAYAIFCPLLLPELAPRMWLDIGTAAFYVTNLRETFWHADTPLSHTWSLAIEEQFYILWPLVLISLLRLPRERAATCLLGAWAALSLARVVCVVLLPSHPAAYYFTPLHATGLLLGSALALRPVATRHGRAAFALLAVLLLFGHTHLSFVYVLPLAELCAALVIADPPKWLADGVPRFIGRISYGVYLWHIPLIWVIPALLVVPASLLAGWLSYVLVERWFLDRASRPPALKSLAG